MHSICGQHWLCDFGLFALLCCAAVCAFINVMLQVRAVVAEDATWCPAGHEVLCQQCDISEPFLKMSGVGVDAPNSISKQPTLARLHVETQPGQHVTIRASGTTCNTTSLKSHHFF